RIGAGSLCVKDTDAACAGSTAGTIYATNTTVQAADVAENYISSESLESGEIVKPANDGNNQAVVKSISSYETTLIGIISTRPGVTLSSDTATDSAHPNLYPVALAGRIPVKVSTENGPIEKGDFLTSSSTPGVAMKATQPGQMIGKALESYSDVEIDKIMVFVNVSFADPGNFLASLSLDEEGNLIMPNIKVDKLTVASELKVDGALLAKDNLDPIAPTYTDLSISFRTLAEKESTNSAQIADLTGQVASASAEIASASAALAKVQSDINELKLTPPDILLATGSATLANLEVTSEATVSGMLTAYAAEIQDNFKVLGPSTLATTLIAGDLTVDGTMSISGDSINAISTLYIQNDLLSSSIDFFNGKVTIDKNGNIVSLGEIAAASVVTNKLTISNTPIASGSATLAASIGSETIPAGQTQITISTEDISTGSKVFITPTSVTDKVLSVTSIEEGISFDVSMLSPSTADINFNWWIVGTR
ncbi:hypothetical protein KKE03_02240, partial [Patescibacteria group bacterium]|nr:hypothetical protein [Patescibacteria group bacterium]